MTADDALKALDRTVLLIQRDFYPTLTPAQIGAELTGIHVHIVGDKSNLGTTAAQTFVITTAIAIAQTGAQLTLDLGDVAMMGRQAPLAGNGDLRAALMDHLSRLPLFRSQPIGPAAVVVCVGDTSPGSAVLTAPTVLRVTGDDFSAELVSSPVPVRRWVGEQPFGGGIGAVAVAADVFRLVVRALSIKHQLAVPSSFSLEIAPHTRIGLTPIPVPPATELLVDLVSAGTITNATLMMLARVPELTLRGRIFDDDSVALENLNRYPLFTSDQIGLAKLTALLAVVPNIWKLEPIHERLTRTTAAVYGPLANLTLVGADSIPTRRLTQLNSPEWLCVAGTAHFEVLISEHLPHTACAGCVHPRDDQSSDVIPTVAFVSLLAGILQGHRLISYATTGIPEPAAVAWPLAFAEHTPMHRFTPAGNADCPVKCAASAGADR